MIRAFLVWLQTTLGKGPGPDDQSWSEALLGSLNFWGLLEGTHLLTLMLFAGTIAMGSRPARSALSSRILSLLA